MGCKEAGRHATGCVACYGAACCLPVWGKWRCRVTVVLLLVLLLGMYVGLMLVLWFMEVILWLARLMILLSMLLYFLLVLLQPFLQGALAYECM